MKCLSSSHVKLSTWSLINAILVLSLLVFLWGDQSQSSPAPTIHGKPFSTDTFFFNYPSLIVFLLMLLLISTVVCLQQVLSREAFKKKSAGNEKGIPSCLCNNPQKVSPCDKSVKAVISAVQSSSVQKRFFADIAHELGSPLARLQMGLAAFEMRLCDVQKKKLQSIIDDVDHMSDLVNELFYFSKTGLSSESDGMRTINLRTIVEKSILREGNEETHIINDIPQSLSALAIPRLLSRAIDNLIRNAVRYAGNAGPIMVSAQKQHSSVLLLIQDQGPSVPEEKLDRIFEPFFRNDTSRYQNSGGAGLGLAIAKDAIESCGGRITAKIGEPSGLTIETILVSPCRFHGRPS